MTFTIHIPMWLIWTICAVPVVFGFVILGAHLMLRLLSPFITPWFRR